MSDLIKDERLLIIYLQCCNYWTVLFWWKHIKKTQPHTETQLEKDDLTSLRVPVGL